MRRSSTSIAFTILVLTTGARADASVLCARLGADGKPHSVLRVRESCKSREVQVTPEMVGFCCTATTSTTSTTATTTPGICPTSTTLGAPSCQLVGSQCLGVCFGGQSCIDDGAGGCMCNGPPLCQYTAQCGGFCP